MIALDVSRLSARYGSVNVLHGMNFVVNRGEMVALLGANGAGKTTTLRALSGVVSHYGSIKLDGREIQGMTPAARVALGLAHVPQGRGTFHSFTVRDNLRIAAHTVKDKSRIEADIEACFLRFPRLRERYNQTAGSMSGGEQQMLAIARAMMQRPKVLMCDEPSLGLAPAITKELFAILRELSQEREMAVLIVEQNAQLTLEIATRAYIVDHGKIQLEGKAEDLKADDTIRRVYLGYDA